MLSGFFLLYLYHSQTMKIAKHLENINQLPTVATKVLEFGSFVPRRIDLLFSVFENFFIWFFLVSGIIITCYKIIISEDRGGNADVLILSFAVPLLSLIIYKFAYPYFYVFMLSLPIIYCGVYLENLYENARRNRSSISIVLIIISIVFVFINHLIYFKINSFDQNESQKEIVETVHKIFPNSVPYIDRCSMISSYPKVGLQMTAFDLEQYIKANTPIMKNILFRDEPVFLIANIGLLDLSLPKEKARTIGDYSLLEEDFITLKANFVYHWGHLYVAGKHFNFGTHAKSQEFEVLIPGNYTIEAGMEILINGTVYLPGDKVYLEKRRYTITSRTIPLEVTLRWGENLSKPVYDPSDQPIFFGFYWRRGVFP